jgi:hypothetical protein
MTAPGYMAIAWLFPLSREIHSWITGKAVVAGIADAIAAARVRVRDRRAAAVAPDCRRPAKV